MDLLVRNWTELSLGDKKWKNHENPEGPAVYEPLTVQRVNWTELSTGGKKWMNRDNSEVPAAWLGTSDCTESELDRVATRWQEVKALWQLWRFCCLWTSNCTESEVECVVTGVTRIEGTMTTLKRSCWLWTSNCTESELDSVVPRWETVKGTMTTLQVRRVKKLRLSRGNWNHVVTTAGQFYSLWGIDFVNL